MNFQKRAEKSEMCRYWDGLIKLSKTLTSLIAADRDGNWALHLLSIQELLPVFCVSGSIIYQRYGSWYLDKMRKLPEEYPEIYKNYLDGKFFVKTGHGHFNAVAPDMKLEQTIQRSKKGAGGVVGQTTHKAFVTELELCYHEVLAISKYHAVITGSVLASSDAEPLHRELRKTSILEYNASKVAAFINERGNPYLTSACSTLHHFTSGQVVTPDVSKQLLAYFKSGLQEYMSFRNARFVTKEMKLSDTIKRKNLLSFRAKGKAASLEGSSLQTKKATSKKLGKMQKEIDMARSHSNERVAEARSCRGKSTL